MKRLLVLLLALSMLLSMTACNRPAADQEGTESPAQEASSQPSAAESSQPDEEVDLLTDLELRVASQEPS